MVPVEVVFFDVGGVLLDMGGEERRSLWPSRVGMDAASFNEAVWDAIGLRDKHAMVEVTQRLVQNLGVLESQVPQLLDDFSAHWQRNEALVELLRGLRGSYRLAIISNIPPSGRFAFETVLRLDEIFDSMFLSGELGVEKPDPAIFEIACTEMHVAAENSVFVDDLPENVQGARAFGMAAHEHIDNDGTIRWLRSQLDWFGSARA